MKKNFYLSVFIIISCSYISPAIAKSAYEQALGEIVSKDQDTLTTMNAMNLASIYTANAYLFVCSDDPEITEEKKFSFSDNKKHITESSLNDLHDTLQPQLNNVQKAAQEEIIDQGCESKMGLRGKKAFKLYVGMTPEKFQIFNAIVSSKLKEKNLK